MSDSPAILGLMCVSFYDAASATAAPVGGSPQGELAGSRRLRFLRLHWPDPGAQPLEGELPNLEVEIFMIGPGPALGKTESEGPERLMSTGVEKISS